MAVPPFRETKTKRRDKKISEKKKKKEKKLDVTALRGTLEFNS